MMSCVQSLTAQLPTDTICLPIAKVKKLTILAAERNHFHSEAERYCLQLDAKEKKIKQQNTFLKIGGGLIAGLIAGLVIKK